MLCVLKRLCERIMFWFSCAR